MVFGVKQKRIMKFYTRESMIANTPNIYLLLLKWINSIFQNNEPRKQIDIIINCTPIGMWPDTESMPEFKISKGHFLADTIYNPLETKWLRLGRKKGGKVVGGLDMFIEQGLASADIWFKKKISKPSG